MQPLVTRPSFWPVFLTIAAFLLIGKIILSFEATAPATFEQTTKIKEGMLPKDIEAIFGKPENAESFGNGEGVFLHYHYLKGQFHFTKKDGNWSLYKWEIPNVEVKDGTQKSSP